MGDVIGGIGDAFSDLIHGAENIVGSAVQTIGSTLQNIASNPLPTIETLALVALDVPYPVASAAVTAANGGSLENVAIAAATSYIGSQIPGVCLLYTSPSPRD